MEGTAVGSIGGLGEGLGRLPRMVVSLSHRQASYTTKAQRVPRGSVLLLGSRPHTSPGGHSAAGPGRWVFFIEASSPSAADRRSSSLLQMIQ